MSVVYGAYFSTSGGKNFVRPVIDYTVSYTATKVSVTYKAGINVKSGWHTNAKFTSTFSATGQASKTREDNNKNWQAGNHFIFGSTTITYNKTTSAQTKTLKMYSKSSVDSSSKSVSINIPALGLPTISDATAGRVENAPTSVTVSFKASSSNNSTITAKINGEVVTAVDGVYSKTFTNVSSDQHNYTITATDSVGTSTRTLTVSRLAPPQVDVVCARDETDATKVLFNITVNSFYKDNISGISITVGSISATVTGGEIGDSNALTVTKELTGLAETALTATVSVTGYGGTTTLNVTVPSAFKTFDVGGEGKTIAFGMTARDEDVENGITIPGNGLFECGMDADFNGMTNINGILIKGCHKIRTSSTGNAGTYTYDSIGWYMNESQIVYLEENISEQLNGIILVWSYYNGSAAQNWGWNFTVIPKAWIPDNPDNMGMTTFMVETATVGNVGAKYLYVRDNRIVGNQNNNKTGTGTSGIKYSNNAFVLRWVYGF